MIPVADILRQLEAQGLTQAELADALKVSQPTISRWTTGSEPRGDNRDRLRALAEGRGIVLESGRAAGHSRGRHAPFPAPTPVPEVSWVSAGALKDHGQELPPDDLPIHQMFDLGPGDYLALRVKGDSMDRISPENSMIIVNRHDRNLQRGKPYVFALRGEATFKIWEPSPPRLEPLSTNPANKPIFVDRMSRLVVVGRVRRTILDL